MDLVLYTAARSRGLMVAWLLEELALPYRVQVLDLERGEHRTDTYRQVHPLGFVPALTVDEEPLVESLAIALYLADIAPGAGLAPAPEHPLRGRYLQWMVYATATVEPKLAAPFVRSLDRPRTEWSSVSTGEERLALMEVLRPLAGAFERGHVLPQALSAADILLGCQLHWADQIGMLAEAHTARAYLGGLRERPSWTRLNQRAHPDSVYVRPS